MCDIWAIQFKHGLIFTSSWTNAIGDISLVGGACAKDEKWGTSSELKQFFICRPEEYKKKVSEYVRKYASEEALRQAEATAVSSSSESSMSDFSEDEAQVKMNTNQHVIVAPKTSNFLSAVKTVAES